MTPRLAAPSRRLVKSWRSVPLDAEAYACEAITWLGGPVDMIWAGHLPYQFAQAFDQDLRWRRIVLGGKDRSSELRRHRPYLPISLLSARLRSSVGGDSAITETNLQRRLNKYVRLFEHLNPAALIVTANYDPGIRLLALAARNAQIPVALYGHGLSSPHYWLSLDDDLSTHFLCWTNEEAVEYTRLGISADRVFTVGPLRVVSVPVTKPTATREILWLGSRLRSEAYVDCLRQAARIASFRGSRLIYRPHPLEDISDVSDVVAPDWVVDPRIPLEVQVRSASVVLSGASTALVEAGMAGAATLYISDLVEASPAIANHLNLAANWTTTCNELSEHALLSAESRTASYHYLDPGTEIPRLIHARSFPG